MKFVRNMKIKSAILLVSIVPLLVVTTLSAMIVLDEQKNVKNMDALHAISVMAATMSALVHEQQKERGMTAGFMSSNGKKFADKILEQRKLTDEKKKALLAYFDANPVGHISQDLQDDINALRANITKMEDVRGDVNAFKITMGDAIAYYTGLNGEVLAIIEKAAHISDNAQITLDIVAYANFLQSKERAGIERAVGSAGFAKGEFSPALLNKFKALIQAQDLYADVFVSYARSNDIEAYNKVMEGEAAREVNKMREVAYGGNANEIAKIEATYWFATITKKINGLKQLEDLLSEELLEDMAHIQSSAQNTLIFALVKSALSIIVTLVLVVIVSRQMLGSFNHLLEDMMKVSEGDLNVTFPERTSNEIGAMFDALKVFVKNEEEKRALHEKEQIEVQKKLQHAKDLHEISKKFDDNMTEFLINLDAATNQLTNTSEGLFDISSTGLTKSQELSQASSEASNNVSSVADSTEDMLSSIKEINMQITKASTISAEAVQEAEQAGNTIQTLADSSDKIGEVVTLIQNIAEQTNLLALNATIEAARAGEAGKGFAVVANEVKSLASQTGKATEEIAGQISTMQESTQNSVDVIVKVQGVINQINEIAGSIASAMEEQSAVIQEIVKNTQDASERTTMVGHIASDVSSAATETQDSSSQVRAATNEIGNQANTLKGELETFLSNIKAKI